MTQHITAETVGEWIATAPTKQAARAISHAFNAVYTHPARAAVLANAGRLREIIDFNDSTPDRPLILTFPTLPVGQAVLYLAGLIQVRPGGWMPWHHTAREHEPRVLEMLPEDFDLAVMQAA